CTKYEGINGAAQRLAAGPYFDFW
nr:immunoglobulin heavy chain junction region [Macaca mulatta]MOY18423.1 immunoglobulin heavy chain junction region [Macaca mulatta]MOY18610.1 immunoglobulin heavy chain junction region [Macaca mulatta]MOY18873.1 immunoglobulin heavy chain junction region [Macaca mulatta]MOY19916.1 immunoglobulin heavy chain junction region [Macaca mulatta]